jgi:8-oxo-dGTP pyrophosphatase MutT (NUDIX family)
VPLIAHQLQALDAYFALIDRHPGLFTPRALRPLILQRAALETYAAEKNVVLGLAAQNPYVLFINDLVESTLSTGEVRRYPYLRIVSRGQLAGGTGVVVLGTVENSALGPVGSIVLVEQERHTLGKLELALPRGFAEQGMSNEEQALRELSEETGYTADQTRFLGATTTDSGLTDSVVGFYHAPITRLSGPAVREAGEAVDGVLLLSLQEIWQKIRRGEIQDAFTLQALALYEHTLSAAFVLDLDTRALGPRFGVPSTRLRRDV